MRNQWKIMDFHDFPARRREAGGLRRRRAREGEVLLFRGEPRRPGALQQKRAIGSCIRACFSTCCCHTWCISVYIRDVLILQQKEWSAKVEEEDVSPSVYETCPWQTPLESPTIPLSVQKGLEDSTPRGQESYLAQPREADHGHEDSRKYPAHKQDTTFLRSGCRPAHART